MRCPPCPVGINIHSPPFKENRDLFNQGRPLLEPTICNHYFSTITPEKPSKFSQSIKGPD